MKTCNRCLIRKPLSDFQNRQKNRDGKDAACRTCRQEYDKQKYHSSEKRRADIRRHQKNKEKIIYLWIWEYLLSHPCIDCGESDPVVLEFDHRGSKLGNISNLRKHGSLPKIQAEVAKCDVRCANCHRRKTAKDFDWYKLELGE